MRVYTPGMAQMLSNRLFFYPVHTCEEAIPASLRVVVNGVTLGKIPTNRPDRRSS